MTQTVTTVTTPETPKPRRAIWYETWYRECPVCWRSHYNREARYTPRPEKWEDRNHVDYNAYDGCGDWGY